MNKLLCIFQSRFGMFDTHNDSSKDCNFSGKVFVKKGSKFIDLEGACNLCGNDIKNHNFISPSGIKRVPADKMVEQNRQIILPTRIKQQVESKIVAKCTNCGATCPEDTKKGSVGLCVNCILQQSDNEPNYVTIKPVYCKCGKLSQYSHEKQAFSIFCEYCGKNAVNNAITFKRTLSATNLGKKGIDRESVPFPKNIAELKFCPDCNNVCFYDIRTNLYNAKCRNCISKN